MPKLSIQNSFKNHAFYQMTIFSIPFRFCSNLLFPKSSIKHSQCQWVLMCIGLKARGQKWNWFARSYTIWATVMLWLMPVVSTATNIRNCQSKAAVLERHQWGITGSIQHLRQNGNKQQVHSKDRSTQAQCRCTGCTQNWLNDEWSIYWGIRTVAVNAEAAWTSMQINRGIASHKYTRARRTRWSNVRKENSNPNISCLMWW